MLLYRHLFAHFFIPGMKESIIQCFDCKEVCFSFIEFKMQVETGSSKYNPFIDIIQYIYELCVITLPEKESSILNLLVYFANLFYIC